jgi:hypothetical protein
LGNSPLSGERVGETFEREKPRLGAAILSAVDAGRLSGKLSEEFES